MLEFRRAVATGDLSDLERLSHALGDAFNIDEPGPTSGKTAAHVAAERTHFKVIYWLFEKGADFHRKDLAGKTAFDYLQQEEFTSVGSDPMSRGDRKYHLCNTHYKIWLAHDPEHFMPYLYQDDFKQYRERNPDGYVSLVYSRTLLSGAALADLVDFSEKYRIALISFEETLAELTERFGTEEDKQCYRLARRELSQYPDQKGGNLAVVADLIRWSSVLLRKGSYIDTDVEIGQHEWTDSISVEKSLSLNLGSLVYPDRTTPWLNGDIIGAASLFPRAVDRGDFRITLSKSACFIIKKVQASLLLSCQDKMTARMMQQRFAMVTLSDLSLYLQDYVTSCSSDRCLIDNFSSREMDRIKERGLALFSEAEKASILERMAKLMRRRVEEEYETPELAYRHSRVFRDVSPDDHEKFLTNYMQAILMTNIKEGVKRLSGTSVFSTPLWECIKKDDWEKYSIYADTTVSSAFRSTNTVRFDTDPAENERVCRTGKSAHLSFTPWGMADVLTQLVPYPPLDA